MSWNKRFKDSIRTVSQLEEYIDISPKEAKSLKKVIDRHPMLISRYYMSLIDRDDPNDPIRKMAVPSEEELDLEGSYDTSGERENTKIPGLQHKYSQTVLILAANRCATYCRHCFRKRIVGLPTDEVVSRFNDAIKYIKKHEEANNVLISGGDPFTLPTKVLRTFLTKLSAIPHLNFIRFGTRVPVTFPDRILEDGELVTLLEESSKNKRIYVQTQFNHPKEITEKTTAAVNSLTRAGVTVNNQTVLLKGVNDDPETLAELQNGLVGIGVDPYYVFQCRPVKRVKNNFQVTLRRGYEIVEDAKRMLSGPAKRFKYVMSHKTGKIEIVGASENHMYFKYHQAKNPNNIGKFFKREVGETTGWLDTLKINTFIQGQQHKV